MKKTDYLKAQKRHGLKSGDRVKIMRKAKLGERGWCDCWTPQMTKSIGQIKTVSYDRGKYGVMLEGSGFVWPHFVLRRVK